MYTAVERDQLRAELIALARDDPRISGGALTGSASVGREDAFSDIDLAFGVRAPEDVRAVLDDRSAWMRTRYGAVDELDVKDGAWVYRVFLLPSTVQVDIACVPEAQFGPKAPTFRLLFGSATEIARPRQPDFHDLVGWGWLYALHARSGLARGKPWLAEYMISAVRDQVLVLASVRLGLPFAHARSADLVPAEITKPLEGAIVRDLSTAELRRAMGVAVAALLDESRRVDPALGARLEATLRELVSSASP
jgi:hypothetical protein